MKMFRRRCSALCALIFAFQLFSTSHVSAQEDDADAKALAEYRLTDEGLDNFSQASRNLAAVAKTDPGLANSMEGSDDATIAETAAMYDAEPVVREAIEAADMTSAEYVTFMYSLIQAGMAAWLAEEYGQTELPEGTPRENVDYYIANKEKIEALTEEMQQLSGEGEVE